MARRGSSNRWLERQRRDPFTRAAREQGLRARSAFKLIDLDQRYALLRGGATIVDLGAAPGGFAKAAAQRVGRRGRVVACDLLEMEPIADVAFVQGDFTTAGVVQAVLALLDDRGADLVLSDMAPNISGVRDRDQALVMELADAALDFATRVLNPGGALVVKLFQGNDTDAWTRALGEPFTDVQRARPPATRAASREYYAVARGFRGMAAG